MKNELMKKIRQICSDDVYEIGFASLSGLLHPKWAKYNYGISLIRKLDSQIIDKIKSGPTIEYYNLYNEINFELNKKTEEIVKILQENDIDSVAIKATVEDKDLDDNFKKTLRYSFSHKMVATQAGLGWIGKTDLLISKRFGPGIRLASILTISNIFKTGTPINESECGSCDLCVKKCPVKAATDMTWTSSIDRDNFYNPFKCGDFAKKISADNIQKEISLCGICISVCPKGKK